MRRLDVFACVSVIAFTLCPCAVAVRAQDASVPVVKAEPERLPRDYQDVGYCLTQYEIEHFSELLDLSPEQHETMMEMFREVRRRVFEAEMPLRKSRDDFVQFSMTWFEGDREQVEANRARLREWMEKLNTEQRAFGAFQNQVVSAFFEDLELLLTPAQTDRLDDAIRWRHRFRLLRYGMIPYSDFSVADVARSMELRVDADRFEGDERPSLESIYEEYEIELDRLLVRRVEAEREFAGGARGMGDGRSGSDEAGSEDDAEKWREAVGEANLRLVNMQKKYIRRIANLLEPEDAAAFQQRCYEKAYWHVLADSTMDKEFADLLEHPALTDEQRARVEAVRDEYRAARAPIEERWIRALDDFLSKGGARIAAAEVPAAIGDPLRENDDSDGLFEFVKQEIELRRAYAERLSELRAEFGLDEDAEQPAG